jgi:lipopolysaccharide export system permease protein
MSADSEIAAMRACGIHLASVIKWPAAFGLACTLLGFYVNNEIVPRGHEIRRTLKRRVSVGAGLSVLEPGRIIDDFPNVKLYFGAKEGNWLYDIVVLDYSQKVDRMITASKALVTSEGTDLHLDLYQMTVDPLDEDHPTMARATRFPYVVKDAIKEVKYSKKDKDLDFGEILEKMSLQKKFIELAQGRSKTVGTEKNLRKRDLSKTRTEFSKRFVFAMASFCFVLVGIPLGIKAQRRESSIGMAISLAVSLGYYIVVILMLSAQKNFAIRPDILIWLPVPACLAIASYLIPKNL